MSEKNYRGRWVLQGEFAIVRRRQGIEQRLYTYANSSDFPDYDILLMGRTDDFPPERVPLNEEIWQEIGKRFEYKFRKKQAGEKK